MKLSDYADNVHSQFGEDGMIAEVFRRIGEGSRTCVEFGAADGLSCSNTAALWQDGWHALLIESDPDRWQELYKNAFRFDTDLLESMVTPDNIDGLLGVDFARPDLMSIDVDGDDYAIWEGMQARPRVVVIEYNQSIPPHVSLRQAELGDCFGASVDALVELGIFKGYVLVGMTRANLFFVEQMMTGAFDDLERRSDRLFDYSALTYVVTDNDGRPAALGTPPWGWNRGSYLGEVHGEIQRLPVDPAELFEAYDDQYGPGIVIRHYDLNIVDQRPEAQTREKIGGFLANLSEDYKLVGIEIDHVPDEELGLLAWIEPLATLHGYRYRMDPGLITLIRG